jgi:hydroxymethylglutaryl-CoA reductase
MTRSVNARIQGLYKQTIQQRVQLVCAALGLDGEQTQKLRAFLLAGGGLELETADAMSENVLATFGLPFSVATNFLVNGRDYLVPMAIEEPSVVAAASNAARMVRECGGFSADADPSMMTAQVQLDAVADIHQAGQKLRQIERAILAQGDAAIPKMVERGGGCRELSVRVLSETDGVLVVDVLIAVGDAMGANMVDSVAEAIAPLIHQTVGGQMGLRILSNLPLRRCVRVRCRVLDAQLGGPQIADGIVRASRFASLDVLRAVTHNKGFMNGVDAAAVALGQDWRSIEAGAHAFASLKGSYRPLSTWHRVDGAIEGTAELPLAVGTVGGSTQTHRGVRAAFAILQVAGARELASVMASVGLASNLAALRALASEGIQHGHMKLHRRKQSDEQSAAFAADHRTSPTRPESGSGHTNGTTAASQRRAP